jgi:hypothetical protein
LGEKRPEYIGHAVGMLDRQAMARALDHFEPGTGYALGQPMRVRYRAFGSVAAVHDQGRHLD